VLRILPLYYSVLLFMFAAVPLVRPAYALMILARSSPWWAYPLFLQNFLVAQSTLAAGPLGVTWSVAIEEQFYLLWPLVVCWFSFKVLRRIAAIMILVSPALTFYLYAHHVYTYSNVFCRQVGLMAGALLALLLCSANFAPAQYVKRGWLVFLVTATLAFVSEAMGTRWLSFTLVALAAASFIFLALHAPQKWLQALLRNRFLIYTGTISYGLYLLHKIPADAAQVLHLDRHPLLLLPFVFVASYALAALSWNVLEKPFLRMKRFFPSSPTMQS
jgi:peptidoglycan/LPS O-acetylase OafA/YrhL